MNASAILLRRAVGFSLLMLVGCGPTPAGSPGEGDDGDDGLRVDSGPRGPGGGRDVDELADASPPQVCSKMDILFVIDNSGSVTEKQTNLVANFPAFIDVLDEFTDAGGQPIDYRVAVTSTGIDKSWTIDMAGITTPQSQSGDNGALLQRCNMTRRWIERADGDVVDNFSCLATLGTEGPGVEMPLELLKMAFDQRMSDSTNEGSHREDALLGVVILTDEDDCSRAGGNFNVTVEGLFPSPEELDRAMCESAEAVDGYKVFLDSYAGGAGRWAVATIAGPGPGSCTSDFGDAAEAVRLKDFVGQAGANGVFSSICDGNLSISLEQALATFDAACQTFPPID